MMNTPTMPIQAETEQQQRPRERHLTPPMTVRQLKAMLSECPPHRDIRMYCDEPMDRDIREYFAGESQAQAIVARAAARLDRRLRYHPTRGVVSGDPMPVAQGVGTDYGSRGAFAVSATGVLAHRAVAQRRQLVWVDRAGTVRGTVGPADDTALANPELSPDGRRVAVDRTVQGNRDVWLIEVGSGAVSRFTFDANVDAIPVWSPDGRRVVFLSRRNGGIQDLFESRRVAPAASSHCS